MDRNEIAALLSYAQGVGWSDPAHDLDDLSRRLTADSAEADKTLSDDASRFVIAFLASRQGQLYQRLTGLDSGRALANQAARYRLSPRSAAPAGLGTSPSPPSTPTDLSQPTRKGWNLLDRDLEGLLRKEEPLCIAVKGGMVLSLKKNNDSRVASTSHLILLNRIPVGGVNFDEFQGSIILDNITLSQQRDGMETAVLKWIAWQTYESGRTFEIRLIENPDMVAISWEEGLFPEGSLVTIRGNAGERKVPWTEENLGEIEDAILSGIRADISSPATRAERLAPEIPSTTEPLPLDITTVLKKLTVARLPTIELGETAYPVATPEHLKALRDEGYHLEDRGDGIYEWKLDFPGGHSVSGELLCPAGIEVPDLKEKKPVDQVLALVQRAEELHNTDRASAQFLLLEAAAIIEKEDFSLPDFFKILSAYQRLGPRPAGAVSDLSLNYWMIADLIEQKFNYAASLRAQGCDVQAGLFELAAAYVAFREERFDDHAHRLTQAVQDFRRGGKPEMAKPIEDRLKESFEEPPIRPFYQEPAPAPDPDMAGQILGAMTSNHWEIILCYHGLKPTVLMDRESLSAPEEALLKRIGLAVLSPGTGQSPLVYNPASVRAQIDHHKDIFQWEQFGETDEEILTKVFQDTEKNPAALFLGYDPMTAVNDYERAPFTLSVKILSGGHIGKGIGFRALNLSNAREIGGRVHDLLQKITTHLGMVSPKLEIDASEDIDFEPDPTIFVRAFDVAQPGISPAAAASEPSGSVFPRLSWLDYGQMSDDEKAAYRAAFYDEFRDREDMRSGRVEPYPLENDSLLEVLVQSARAIGEKYAGSRIYSLGASPQWFVATAQLLDPEPGRFDFIPFSGRWYHPEPGLTGDYVADAEMAPTPEQIGDYRKLLEGLGLHPEAIIQRESPTVIVETIQGGASTLSFIEGILFAWAKELGLADSLRAKLRIHCLVPRKWPTDHAMNMHMALVKRAMKNYEALIEYEILPANLVDALGGLSDEYHDRLVPYHNVAHPWRDEQSHEEAWDSGAGLVRFRVMDYLATHHPDLMPSLSPGNPNQKDPTEIPIEAILGMQSRLRASAERKGGLKRVYLEAGRLPAPVVINIFEDGQMYLRDGHHRLALLRELGITHLRNSDTQKDFVIERATYARYNEVNFRTNDDGTLNLATSWITPFNPRTHVRKHNLRPFKTLIKFFIDSGLPPDSVAHFIRAHPEMYALPRHEGDALADQPCPQCERDWDDYLARMGASRHPKIAQFLPLIPTDGIHFEIGSGGGEMADAYAELHPGLLVVGVDKMPQAVDAADSRFGRRNLVFLEADARTPFTLPSSVDSIGESSFLHELFSFSGFDADAVDEYYAQVAGSLRPGGLYASRDFAPPHWPEKVRLRLPTRPEEGPGAYGKLSRAELFEVYARDFRSRAYTDGVRYTEIPSDDPAWRLFETDSVAAANFVLRMEYRNNWEAELKEQYVNLSLDEKRRLLERHGLRVDYLGEVHNTWIYLNWWKNRLAITDTEGRPLDLPPTNGLVFAVKPGPDDPKGLAIRRAKTGEAPTWLHLSSFRHTERPDVICDLIHVPGPTDFYLPFERGDDGKFYVYLHRRAERPGLLYYSGQAKVHGAYFSGYTAEGFGQVVTSDLRDRTTAERFGTVLQRKTKANLDDDTLANIEATPLDGFLLSPGISDEQVFPFLIDLTNAPHDSLRSTGVGRLELNQLLASAHVGSLPDPRLEVVTYRLAMRMGVPLVDWFDGTPPVQQQPVNGLPIVSNYSEIAAIQAQPLFEPSELPAGFAEVVHVDLTRTGANNETVDLRREFMVPRNFSVDTFSVVPYFQSGGQLFVGLETRELPAFQVRGMNPRVAVIPAWRIPPEISSRVEANRFVRERMSKDFSIADRHVTPLGEGYFPSAAQTPERVTPFAVEIDTSSPPRGLTFVPIERLVIEIDTIPDLHTRVGLLRLAHAFGRLSSNSPPRHEQAQQDLAISEIGGFRGRAEIFPALTKWLNLGEPFETIDVPVSVIRGRMKDKLDELLSSLSRIYHLKYAGSPHTAEEKMDELSRELGLVGTEPKPEGDDWKTLTAADMDCLDSQEELIGRIRRIAADLASFPNNPTVRFQVSLWNRERPSGLKLPAEIEKDLGCQVITVSLPDGRIVDGFVLRLLRHGDELVVALSEPVGGDHDHYSLIDHLRPAVLNIAKEIASRLGIKSSVRFLPSAQVTWRQPPFVPVMAPQGAEKALEAIEKKVIHPERNLLAWPRASYEALRPARKGKIDLKIPWWGSLPSALEAVWGFEIEPNPQPEDVEKYVWVFNAGTGRAIEVYLPDGHRTSDGTVWNHLSVIGVGKTARASSVSVDSDGLLKWDNAWTRFYWSNYLHWVGSPLGLRTSLAVALFDRADLQADSDTQHGQYAVVAELRREQLRLWDLSPDLELTGRILERVEKQVAAELGRPEMSHEDYIGWLADTLGTQFAILQYLKVDHGESLEPPPKIPQLHAGQFTLVGEICDFEQAAFGGKSETRYLRNDFRWADHLDIERIHELQKRVGEARSEGRSLLDDYRGTAGDRDLGAGGLWLAILLEMAPNVDFAGTVEEAYRKKLRELEQSGPDPEEARNRFDREKWSSLHLPSPGSPLQTVSSFLKFGALVDVCRLLFLLDRVTLLDTEQKKLLPKFHSYAGPSLWTDKMFLLFKVADSLEKISAQISGQEGLATLAPMLLSLSKSVKGAYESGDQSEYEDTPQEKRRLRFESETLLDKAAPDLRRAADLLLRHLKTADEAEAGRTEDELSRTESGLRLAIAASWLDQIGETRDRFSVKRSPDFWMALHRLHSRLSRGEDQTAQEVETALEGLRGLLGELPTENQPIVALQLYTPRDLVTGAIDALEQLLTTSAPPSSTPLEPNLPTRSGSPTPSATHAGAGHQMPRGMTFTLTPNASPQRRGHIRGPVIHLAFERGLKKAAEVAARLSDKALATLADRDRLNKVLDKTGYAWAKGGLGPWGRKIAPSDLLLLGLAALARCDEEVALTLQRISGQPTDAVAVGAAKGLPTGAVPAPTIGLPGTLPITVGR